MKLYEALFLLDADAKPENGHEEYLHEMLKKHGATVASTDRWGERKLAYEIKRRKRGLYFLIHFNAPPEAIAEIRRTCHISELILRELILVDEDGHIKAKADSLLGGSAPVAGAPGESAVHA